MGYDKDQLMQQLETDISVQAFFGGTLHVKNRIQIKGSICGVKLEKIKKPLLGDILYLVSWQMNLPEESNMIRGQRLTELCLL